MSFDDSSIFMSNKDSGFIVLGGGKPIIFLLKGALHWIQLKILLLILLLLSEKVLSNYLSC